jgi:hypothetical protein
LLYPAKILAFWQIEEKVSNKISDLQGSAVFIKVVARCDRSSSLLGTV